MSTPFDPGQGGGPVAHSPGLAPYAPGEPDAPEGRRPPRATLWISLGVLVVVAAGSFLGLNAVLSPGREDTRQEGVDRLVEEVAGPEHVVQAHLDALAAGNARGAWAIANGTLPYAADPTVDPEIAFPEPSLLLDNKAYGETGSPTDPTVDGVEITGSGKAEVTASYTLDGTKTTQVFALERATTADEEGIYAWRFTTPPIGEITVTAPVDRRVVVNDVEITTWIPEDEPLVLPAMVGSYSFVLLDGEGKEVDTETVVVSTTDEDTTVELGS